MFFPSSFNLWLIESKNGINSEKKMFERKEAFLYFRNDVPFLGNYFAGFRLPRFISRVQRVLSFSNLIKRLFRGYYFREFNRKFRNRENTGNQYH